MGQRQDAQREAAHTKQPPSRLGEFDFVHSPPPDLLIYGANGLPYRFEDPCDLVHGVESSRMVPTETTTFFMWTRCGQQDVPARDVYASWAQATCPDCVQIERHSTLSCPTSTLIRLMRADFALARDLARVEKAEQTGGDGSRARDDAWNHLGTIYAFERDLGRSSRWI